eukprot:TRINITY_DN11690_c0_g1_i2.p1 TRINITY_DN11690_c0_g1~~TRINITY_DN11690_c0_g1_i2.p1  ORF type:complete len:1011 (+),score=346.67 TRINITY_DN11690_c0_g1_i2:80-3112(+)
MASDVEETERDAAAELPLPPSRASTAGSVRTAAALLPLPVGTPRRGSASPAEAAAALAATFVEVVARLESARRELLERHQDDAREAAVAQLQGDRAAAAAAADARAEVEALLQREGDIAMVGHSVERRSLHEELRRQRGAAQHRAAERLRLLRETQQDEQESSAARRNSELRELDRSAREHERLWLVEVAEERARGWGDHRRAAWWRGCGIVAQEADCRRCMLAAGTLPVVETGEAEARAAVQAAEGAARAAELAPVHRSWDPRMLQDCERRLREPIAEEWRAVCEALWRQSGISELLRGFVSSSQRHYLHLQRVEVWGAAAEGGIALAAAEGRERTQCEQLRRIAALAARLRHEARVISDATACIARLAEGGEPQGRAALQELAEPLQRGALAGAERRRRRWLLGLRWELLRMTPLAEEEAGALALARDCWLLALEARNSRLLRLLRAERAHRHRQRRALGNWEGDGREVVDFAQTAERAAFQKAAAAQIAIVRRKGALCEEEGLRRLEVADEQRADGLRLLRQHRLQRQELVDRWYVWTEADCALGPLRDKVAHPPMMPSQVRFLAIRAVATGIMRHALHNGVAWLFKRRAQCVQLRPLALSSAAALMRRYLHTLWNYTLRRRRIKRRVAESIRMARLSDKRLRRAAWRRLAQWALQGAERRAMEHRKARLRERERARRQRMAAAALRREQAAEQQQLAEEELPPPPATRPGAEHARGWAVARLIDAAPRRRRRRGLLLLVRAIRCDAKAAAAAEKAAAAAAGGGRGSSRSRSPPRQRQRGPPTPPPRPHDRSTSPSPSPPPPRRGPPAAGEALRRELAEAKKETELALRLREQAARQRLQGSPARGGARRPPPRAAGRGALAKPARRGAKQVRLPPLRGPPPPQHLPTPAPSPHRLRPGAPPPAWAAGDAVLGDARFAPPAAGVVAEGITAGYALRALQALQLRQQVMLSKIAEAAGAPPAARPGGGDSPPAGRAQPGAASAHGLAQHRPYRSRPGRLPPVAAPAAG